MDVVHQVLLLINLASFTNGKLENADLHNLASQVKVTYYGCGELTENNLDALNQVSKCNIASKNLEISRAKITMYTKQVRQEINATVCRVKCQNKERHCGFEEDPSMDAHYTGGITIDLTVTSSQCRTLAKGGSITSKDETIEFKKGVKTTVVEQKDFDNDRADRSDKYKTNSTHMDE